MSSWLCTIGVRAWIFVGSTPYRPSQSPGLHGGDRPAFSFLGRMARSNERVLQEAAHVGRGRVDSSEESFHRISPPSKRSLAGGDRGLSSLLSKPRPGS